MTEDVADRRMGIIEGSSRVLRELIRTPRVRGTLSLLLRHLDPENAPLLVRVLMDDPAQFFAALGCAAPLANAAIGAAHELLDTFSSYPPGMLKAFAARMVNEIDTERLGATAAALVALLVRLAPAREGASDGPLSQSLAAFGRGFWGGLERADVDRAALLERAAARSRRVADRLRDGARDNPELVEVIRPLVVAVRELAAGTDGGER